MTTTEHNTADDFATPRRDRLRRAFFRFSQSKLSMLGAAIVTVVIFFTVFGTVLAPYPNHVAGGVDTASRFVPRRRPIPSAPTSSVRTCCRWSWPAPPFRCSPASASCSSAR